MADEKRIYDLDDVTTDISNIYFMGDDPDADESTRVIGSDIIFLISVESLPTTSINTNSVYYLSAIDGNAPVGYYINDGGGWVCFAQMGDISLSNWSGDVSEELYSGVVYTVTVDGDVTSLVLTLDTVGSAYITTYNSDALYTIAEPSSNYTYKRTDTGLTDISTEIAEIVVSNINDILNYSAVEIVAI